MVVANEIFQWWVRTRIDTTLGPVWLGNAPSIATAQPQGQDLTHLSANTMGFGKWILNALQPAATAAAASGTTLAGKPACRTERSTTSSK